MAEEENKTGEDTTNTQQSAIVPATDTQIRDLIYVIRGQQVMLDRDLTMLYDVETRMLNQAVTRNPRRFPESFCFRLTREEDESLKSQIVISNEEGRGGRRYPPRVFTEQGVAMLSAILRSETAIEVRVRIMNAFVEMRHFIADNAHMFEQIRDVERRQIEYQQKTDERFERVFDYMDSHEEPTQKDALRHRAGQPPSPLVARQKLSHANPPSARCPRHRSSAGPRPVPAGRCARSGSCACPRAA